jgi:hypothetical protein
VKSALVLFGSSSRPERSEVEGYAFQNPKRHKGRVPHPEQSEGWDTTKRSLFVIPTAAKRSEGICCVLDQAQYLGLRAAQNPASSPHPI